MTATAVVHQQTDGHAEQQSSCQAHQRGRRVSDAGPPPAMMAPVRIVKTVVAIQSRRTIMRIRQKKNTTMNAETSAVHAATIPKTPERQPARRP